AQGVCMGSRTNDLLNRSPENDAFREWTPKPEKSEEPAFLPDVEGPGSAVLFAPLQGDAHVLREVARAELQEMKKSCHLSEEPSEEDVDRQVEVLRARYAEKFCAAA